MSKCCLWFFAPIMVVESLGAEAQEIRTVVQGGVTYQEVHRMVRVPQTQIQCVERPTTYMHERYDVQLIDSVRTYRVPVTQYQLEPRWRGRFNPFAQPYLIYRNVPRLRWETRTEVVKVPITTRQLVPVTTTVRVPVTTETFVDQDMIVSRTPIGLTPTAVVRGPSSGDPFAATTPSLANNSQVGGLKRLDRSSPWQGVVDVNSSGGTQVAAGSSGGAQSSISTQWRQGTTPRR
jgi:hypothetical protein